MVRLFDHVEQDAREATLVINSVKEIPDGEGFTGEVQKTA